MPLLLNNPIHWNLRAQEARLVAQQLEDLEAKTAILKIANEYDHLAAAARMNETVRPVSAVEPMNNSEANATDVVVNAMCKSREAQ